MECFGNPTSLEKKYKSWDMEKTGALISNENEEKHYNKISDFGMSLLLLLLLVSPVPKVNNDQCKDETVPASQSVELRYI